ncbi:DNA-processing protein DprA [Lactobacillus sp. PV034]|uniref:DNA-processing protein DprA n=1 Tax=Lactobacillus sp. PV034 TaxID=2594495 RepID=UPI00223EC852|nr:DNA-processing protein DprA [Lactobacillus sp. PV034]QNQ80473.1 DNA-protecting protein DprA [Lactobacillus sp. PV034]
MNQKEFCLRLKLEKGITARNRQEIIQKLGFQQQEITFDLIQELGLSSELCNKVFHAMKNVQLNQCVERILFQCEVITFFDQLYPEQLREIYNPPIVLFARGNIRLLKKKITVIVGSRYPSKYSSYILKQLVPELVKQDVVIASGLARGVDGIAHRETLANNGKTIAVIGNGLNYFYPQSNQNLQQEIMKNGLVISEYLPDTPPLPFRFVERNRILAGLCENVIVTEAKKKSGSLITANYALEANRNIFAVPGPVSSPLSEGPNALIAAGAYPILKEDLLTTL